MPASKFHQGDANFILKRLEEGKTIPQIIAERPRLKRSTIRDWRHSHPEFGKAYDEAMLEGCHALLDETLAIADDSRNDWMLAAAEDGDEKAAAVLGLNAENVQRSKLRIYARHELIKRKRPDVFSDKVDLNHKGNVGFSIRVRRRSDREGDQD